MSADTIASSNTLRSRIQRRLPSNEQLRRCSDHDDAYRELGEYYIVDTDTNYLVAWKCSLGDLAKELGVTQAPPAR